MPLDVGRTYFVAESDCHLREEAGGGAKLNHLLLGDWLRVLGPEKGDWVQVECRGDIGWLPNRQITGHRALEINFVDIGQGDGCHVVTPDGRTILVDAGVGSNMNRFLSWRYDLRDRNVAGAEDHDPVRPAHEPQVIDHVVISHPDNDHYYGFVDVFENRKLRFGRLWHNGIVERPKEPERPGLRYYSRDDLGGYAVQNGQRYLWDLRLDDAAMRDLIATHSSTRKQLVSTYRAALENSPELVFGALGRPAGTLDAPVHMADFEAENALRIEVLSPLQEEVAFDGESRTSLRRLGDETVTKNGHSVVLRLHYGHLRVVLGGDLNAEAQDFLLQRYSGRAEEASKLEALIACLKLKADSRTPQEEVELRESEAALEDIVARARHFFEADVAKACHHGSHLFSTAFLRAMNALVTVISSGDEESYAHPRPDALGTFGKHGRGERPLIFSTDLARSTREFNPIHVSFQRLQYYQAQIAAAETQAEKARIRREMEMAKDRNVAIYGMITLRALGDKVILAQKLEQPAKNGRKWDIHQLHWSAASGKYHAAR